MSWSWRKYVVWILLVLASLILTKSGYVESCIEEERIALLDLNPYFRSHLEYGYAQFLHYGIGEGEKDKYNCCSWKRVKCSTTTQHVVELDLRKMLFEDYQNPSELVENAWVFNVTMLEPFRQLTSLDLSGNSIRGLVEKHGSTRLSTLKNLQSLVLRDIEPGQIFVSDLTSLRTLTLHWGLNETTLQVIDNDAPPTTSTTTEEDGEGLDMEDFLWTFGATSIIAFMATITVLSINRQWREAFFDFVEWHLLWWLL